MVLGYWKFNNKVLVKSYRSKSITSVPKGFEDGSFYYVKDLKDFRPYVVYECMVLQNELESLGHEVVGYRFKINLRKHITPLKENSMVMIFLCTANSRYMVMEGYVDDMMPYFSLTEKECLDIIADRRTKSENF